MCSFQRTSNCTAETPPWPSARDCTYIKEYRRGYRYYCALKLRPVHTTSVSDRGEWQEQAQNVVHSRRPARRSLTAFEAGRVGDVNPDWWFQVSVECVYSAENRTNQFQCDHLYLSFPCLYFRQIIVYSRWLLVQSNKIKLSNPQQISLFHLFSNGLIKWLLYALLQQTVFCVSTCPIIWPSLFS